MRDRHAQVRLSRPPVRLVAEREEGRDRPTQECGRHLTGEDATPKRISNDGTAAQHAEEAAAAHTCPLY